MEQGKGFILWIGGVVQKVYTVKKNRKEEEEESYFFFSVLKGTV